MVTSVWVETALAASNGGAAQAVPRAPWACGAVSCTLSQQLRTLPEASLPARAQLQAQPEVPVCGLVRSPEYAHSPAVVHVPDS